MKIKGEHEIYCCGAKVQISEREGIKLLSIPTVEYCPLHEALYGTKKIDAEAVQKTVEKKIASYGFCCENRVLNAEPVVAYGASEMMKVWLEKGFIDCAVVVCEGAGTVITQNGGLVQAIGARLTGIVRTSPIKPIIEHIEANGGTVLDKESAKINQVEGVKKAFNLGFKRIAVSIAGFQAETIDEIRRFQEEAKADVLVFSVCNTCVDDAAIRYIAEADIACASASKILREKIGEKALMQLGVTIPVYVLTEKGKKLVLAYLSEYGEKLVVFKTNNLPYNIASKGPRLKPP
ncbi:MAG: methanogenesis marker 8 protein [Candidatus Bathyarchaeia archaeon]